MYGASFFAERNRMEITQKTPWNKVREYLEKQLNRDVTRFASVVQKKIGEKYGKNVCEKQGALIPLLTDTPLPLLLLGQARNRTVKVGEGGIFATGHFFDSKHRNVGAALMRKLPQALQDPVAIFDSFDKNGQKNGDVIIMLNLKDRNGSTLIMPMEFAKKKNERGEVSNLAKTVYAKERDGKSNNGWLMKRLLANALYINTEKVKAWQKETGMEFPLSEISNPRTERLYTEKDLKDVQELVTKIHDRNKMVSEIIQYQSPMLAQWGNIRKAEPKFAGEDWALKLDLDDLRLSIEYFPPGMDMQKDSDRQVIVDTKNSPCVKKCKNKIKEKIGKFLSSRSETVLKEYRQKVETGKKRKMNC